MEPGWDKRLTKTLVNLGLSWKDARIAVGVIAEQREISYRQGYVRGYIHGSADTLKKDG